MAYLEAIHKVTLAIHPHRQIATFLFLEAKQALAATGFHHFGSFVGVMLFVLGLASLFYPPQRVVIGSVATSAAILSGEVALMALPALIAGNELLIRTPKFKPLIFANGR